MTLNLIQSPLCLMAGFGGHHRNGIPDIADPFFAEHRPVGNEVFEAVGPLNVFGGQYTHNTGFP